MIGDIIENQSFEAENVLHYHGWVTQQQMNEIFAKANELMNKHQAKNNGPVTTATRAVEMRDGQPVMDLDVFIPLDKEIETSDDFDFIKQFKLENALKLRIEGSPQQAAAAVGAACGVGATGGFIIIGASVVAVGVAIYGACNS